VNAEELPTIRIYLRFYGPSFDPDEISARLGLSPSNKFRAGDQVGDSAVQRRHDGWLFEGSHGETLDVRDLLQDFRERVGEKSTQVIQLCQDLDVEAVIVCAVLPSSSVMPILEFPPEFSHWAASMGASINIDILALGPDD
jgi:hypothetical protein